MLKLRFFENSHFIYNVFLVLTLNNNNNDYKLEITIKFKFIEG